ncbi:MAG: cyclase [Chloroflexi bacterium]|nr:cyclase [Chloroflexota bacterium]
MAHVLIKHPVEDYAKWKKAYDAHAAMRKQAGSKGSQVFRNSENPSEVTILFEWGSVEQARKFNASADLKEAMQKAGVKGMPEFTYLESTAKHPN